MDIREVERADDPAIDEYVTLRRDVYPDLSRRFEPKYIGRLIEQPGPDRSHLIVAEQDELVMGGTLGHYFSGPRSMFVSFIGVRPEARRQTVATQLRDAGFDLLDRISRGTAIGMFADYVTPDDRDHPRMPPASYDEHVRRLAVLNSWGFRRVALPGYPRPFTLLFAPVDSSVETVSRDIAIDTLAHYWDILVGPGGAGQARQLASSLPDDLRDLRLLDAAPVAL